MVHGEQPPRLSCSAMTAVKEAMAAHSHAAIALCPWRWAGPCLRRTACIGNDLLQHRPVARHDVGERGMNVGKGNAGIGQTLEGEIADRFPSRLGNPDARQLRRVEQRRDAGKRVERRSSTAHRIDIGVSNLPHRLHVVGCHAS